MNSSLQPHGFFHVAVGDSAGWLAAELQTKRPIRVAAQNEFGMSPS